MAGLRGAEVYRWRAVWRVTFTYGGSRVYVATYYDEARAQAAARAWGAWGTDPRDLADGRIGSARGGSVLWGR